MKILIFSLIICFIYCKEQNVDESHFITDKVKHLEELFSNKGITCPLQNEIDLLLSVLKNLNETVKSVENKFDSNISVLVVFIFLLITISLSLTFGLFLYVRDIKKLTELLLDKIECKNDYYYHQSSPYVVHDRKYARKNANKNVGGKELNKINKEISVCSSSSDESYNTDDSQLTTSNESSSYDNIKKYNSSIQSRNERLHQLILARNAFQWRLHACKSASHSSFKKASLIVIFEKNTVIAFNSKTQKLRKFPAAVDYIFYPPKAGVVYNSSTVITPNVIIEHPPEMPLIQYHVIEKDNKKNRIPAAAVVIDLIKKAAAKSIDRNERIILLTPAYISESQKLAYEDAAYKSGFKNFFCTDEQLALGYSISEAVEANIILVNCYETQVIISQFQIENENSRKIIELNETQKSGKNISKFVAAINSMMKEKTFPTEMQIFVTRNRDIFLALKEHYFYRDRTAVLKFMGDFEEKLVKHGSADLHFYLSDIIQLNSEFYMKINNLSPDESVETVPEKKARKHSI